MFHFLSIIDRHGEDHGVAEINCDFIPGFEKLFIRSHDHNYAQYLNNNERCRVVPNNTRGQSKLIHLGEFLRGENKAGIIVADSGTFLLLPLMGENTYLEVVSVGSNEDFTLYYAIEGLESVREIQIGRLTSGIQLFATR